jgi:hypothetical protein
MPLIVVCGALANKAFNGGAAWTRLSWVLGFERLGCDVYFLEQIAPATCVDSTGAPCDISRSANLAFFERVTGQFGLGGRSALVLETDRTTASLRWSDIVDLADSADLLLNISGHLTLDTLKPRFRRRVFLDLDPGYTQFWYAAGMGVERLRDHHFYFTVGENIGGSDCGIPVGDVEWRAIRQPVLLDEWPIVAGRAPAKGGQSRAIDAAPLSSTIDDEHVDDLVRFTTVASWRGPYGCVAHDGVHFGLKAHEFRRFLPLPTLSSHAFEIALDVHPADSRDVESLVSNGWKLTDPRLVAADPMTFRHYVQSSSAEFSVAQGIYVTTRSGWFSDRTVRYLASGRPALVQDTGFTANYPVGQGLLTFRTLDDAQRGADCIARDYDQHARAARAIAERFFDSNTVLRTLLEAVEVAA